MTILTRLSSRCTPQGQTIAATLACVLTLLLGTPSSHAAAKTPLRVTHVHARAVEDSLPSLAIDLELCRQEPRAMPARDDSAAFRIRLSSSGRRWWSGWIAAPSRAAEKRSMTCVLRLADCNALPHEVKLAVESGDGRVLARARWRCPMPSSPVDSAPPTSAEAISAMPAAMPSPAQTTVPSIAVSWGRLKQVYRDPSRPTETALRSAGFVPLARDTVAAAPRLSSVPKGIEHPMPLIPNVRPVNS